jgi:hypothetical protein
MQRATTRGRNATHRHYNYGAHTVKHAGYFGQFRFRDFLCSSDACSSGLPQPRRSAAVLQICCAEIQTTRTAQSASSVLGAILVTGFFGGAICLHLRIGEIGSPPQLVCLAIGLMAWAGLFLRDANLRAVLPVRRLA